MIAYHCRQRLVRWSDTPQYFSKKCLRCGAIFYQRKRQPVSKEDSDCICDEGRGWCYVHGDGGRTDATESASLAGAYLARGD